jgi:hypothetical protein
MWAESRVLTDERFLCYACAGTENAKGPLRNVPVGTGEGVLSLMSR